MKQTRKPYKRLGNYTVYVLRCADGTYYTGYTKDIANRLKLHNSGRGAKYLRGKTPAELAYSHEFKYYKNAVVAERTIKCFPRAKKQKLINGEIPLVLARGFKAPQFSAKKIKCD